ncbi:MAG: hypothetical protein LUC06_08285, partial [Oscillospiraceae bacterium]|nr:hypothetical protein [Oscillospiraceae bacterium]
MEIEQYISENMKIYDFPVDKLIPYENNPLADNKVGEIAAWDERGLLRELQRLASEETAINMSAFGFEDTESLLARIAEDESALDDLRKYDGQGNHGT